MNKINKKREQILLMIVKLKQFNRRKIIKLENQNTYFNNLPDKIIKAKNKKLDMYISKLDKMLKENE